MSEEPKINSGTRGIDELEESVSASILGERIQNVGSYLTIHVCLWTIVAIYLLTREGMFIPAMCGFGSSLSVLILMWIKKKQYFGKFIIVNAYLVITISSLFLIGCLSARNDSSVVFQFPLTCLIAAQLLGSRAAKSWFFLTVVAIYFSIVPPWQPSGSTTSIDLDNLVSALVLAFSVLWICDQAEQFFVKRTAYLQRLTETLSKRTKLLELAEETARVGHWLWYPQSGKTEFSDVLCSFFGNQHEDREDSIDELTDFFDHKGSSRFKETLANAADLGEPFQLELSATDPQGTQRHFTCRGNCQKNELGEVESVFGVIRDETTLKEATQRLSRKADELNRLAIVDPLTGLTNRLQFRRVLNESVRHAAKTGQLMALVVLDMDGFKEINDTLGHATGDLVLCEAAERILASVRGDDVVSRLGGDEFTVILKDVRSIELAQTISQRIVTAIRQPMTFDNNKLEVGASVGLSFCPADSASADELFTFADTAMYEAKFNGKDVALYQPWMTEELIKRKRVESKLAGALDRNEFSVVYQPQYRVRDEKIVGFEALIRWNQDGSVVSPAEFIPHLESSGKIIEVGQWILDKACEQVKVWQQMGFEATVAVNISPIQFRDPKFYDRVTETIASHDVDPTRIDLEITEGVIIDDIERTSLTLSQLKSFGCMISVDDFGTGYSSLAYLKKFPIDRLKIDRVFIKDIPDHDDGMIASSIIVLALSLDMEVLAEGVETQHQLEFLCHQDCQLFQGHLNSGAVDAERCTKLLMDSGIKVNQLAN